MTPVLRSRARIWSASRDNIVGCSANRTIVNSRLRCRSPIIRLACRSLTGSTRRKYGQRCGTLTPVPKDIRFKIKPQIALDQIREAHAEGFASGIVLADAGSGANSDFRAGVSALNLPYVVGIQSTPSGCRRVRRHCLPSRGVAAAGALATCSATTNTSLSRSKTWF